MKKLNLGGSASHIIELVHSSFLLIKGRAPLVFHHEMFLYNLYCPFSLVDHLYHCASQVRPGTNTISLGHPGNKVDRLKNRFMKPEKREEHTHVRIRITYVIKIKNNASRLNDPIASTGGFHSDSF